MEKRKLQKWILSALNSYSIKSAVALDFRQLLQYPLCPVPLSICNGDGTRRRTNKSKLKESLLIGVGSLDKSVLASFQKMFIGWSYSTNQHNGLWIAIDVQQLMQRIPKNYKRVDLLVDDYKNKANSL